MAEIYIRPDSLVLTEIGDIGSRRWALKFKAEGFNVLIDPPERVWMDLFKEIGIRLSDSQLNTAGRAITSNRIGS